jgi:hypothetical protein
MKMFNSEVTMNDQRHYHTESERRQLDGVVTDAEANGWSVSKLNRMKARANNLPDDSLIDYNRDE